MVSATLTYLTKFTTECNKSYKKTVFKRKKTLQIMVDTSLTTFFLLMVPMLLRLRSRIGKSRTFTLKKMLPIKTCSFNIISTTKPFSLRETLSSLMLAITKVMKRKSLLIGLTFYGLIKCFCGFFLFCN